MRRLADRFLVALVRWRLARRKPGTRDEFSGLLTTLLAGELVTRSREAHDVTAAVATLEQQVMAIDKFEQISTESEAFFQ